MEEKIDAVCTLNGCSKYNNREIVFSVKCLQRFVYGLGDLYVVGVKPPPLDWETGNIYHIPEKDDICPGDANIIKKIMTACNDTRISENFLMFHDDHFIIYPHLAWKFPAYCKIHFHTRSTNYKYVRRVKRTLKELYKLKVKKPKNYDLHAPLLINKTEYVRILNKVDWESGNILCKSVYANLTKRLKTVVITDAKVSKADEKMMDRYFFSTKPTVDHTVWDLLKKITTNKKYIPSFEYLLDTHSAGKGAKTTTKEFIMEHSYSDLQKLAKETNVITQGMHLELEIEPIRVVGLKKDDLKSSVVSVLEQLNSEILKEANASEELENLYMNIEQYNKVPEAQIDEEPEPEELSEKDIGEIPDQDETPIPEKNTQKSETEEKPKEPEKKKRQVTKNQSGRPAANKSPQCIHIRRMLDEYKRRRAGQNPWSVSVRTKKFVEIIQYALRNPYEDVLSALLQYMVENRAIVAESLFHSHTDKMITDARTRRRLDRFYTAMVALSKAIRNQRPFRLNIESVRHSIKEEKIVSFIISKSANLEERIKAPKKD